RREAEALAALHGLGDAVDVDKLLDQLLAAVVVAATSTTAIVTPATATAAIAAAASTAAATAAAARPTAMRRLLRLLGLPLLGLRRRRLSYRSRFLRIGIGFVGLLLLVLHSRTPVRLRAQRRRGP